MIVTGIDISFLADQIQKSTIYISLFNLATGKVLKAGGVYLARRGDIHYAINVLLQSSHMPSSEPREYIQK